MHRMPTGALGRAALAVVAAMVLIMAGTAGVASGQPSTDRTITETSMGAAQLGSTQAQLEAELGEGYTYDADGPLFVDTEGVEVSVDGVVQFYALYSAGGGPKYEILITDHVDYELANGVGPGASLSDAVAAMGAATLSLDTETESREFATFADFEGAGMLFQVGGPDGSETAGVYPESSSSANETTEVNDGSTILRIWVLCRPGSCPTASLPDTGASERTLPLVVVAAAMIVAGVMVAVTGSRRATGLA